MSEKIEQFDFPLTDETWMYFNTRKIQPKKVLSALNDKKFEHPFYTCLVAEAMLDLKQDEGYTLVADILKTIHDNLIRGFAYYIIKDWVNCAPTLELCDHYFANFLSGVCHQNGFGVPVDGLKALKFYQKSWDDGYINACSNIGMIYQTGNGVPADQAKAYYYFDVATQKGFGIAVYNVGYALFHGLGVPKDMALSFQKMLLGAEAGCSNAYLYLGCFYHQGKVVEKDFEKAIYWFLLASENDMPYAYYFLGICYGNGDGCVQDRQKAFDYFTRAGRLGVKEARVYLSTSYIWDTDVIPPQTFKLQTITSLHRKKLRFSQVGLFALDTKGGIYISSDSKCLYFPPNSIDSTLVGEYDDYIRKLIWKRGILYVAVKNGVLETISTTQKSKLVCSTGIFQFEVCQTDSGLRIVVIDVTQLVLTCYDGDTYQKLFSHRANRAIHSLVQIAPNLLAYSMDQGIQLLGIGGQLSGDVKAFIDMPDDEMRLTSLPQQHRWATFTRDCIKIWENEYCIGKINLEKFLDRQQHDCICYPTSINGYMAVGVNCRTENWIFFIRDDEIMSVKMENIPITQLGNNNGTLVVASENSLYRFDLSGWLFPLSKALRNEEWVDLFVFTHN
jgi:hypothetical protein